MTSKYLYGLLVLVLLLTGCGAPTSQPTTGQSSGSSPVAAVTGCPDSSGPISKPLIIGAENHLVAMGEDGSSAAPLMSLPETLRAYDPVWSPDGKTLAYTLTSPAADEALAWLPIGVICGMDRETGKGRVLAKGSTPLTSMEEATWTPDGAGLMLAMHQPVLDENKQYVSDTVAVVRYDLATNAVQPLVKGGVSPALAPDGQRLAYVNLDPKTRVRTLMLAQADGSQAQEVEVPSLPGSQGNPPSVGAGPTWSPDGKLLAFTASGAGMAAAPRQAEPRALLDRLFGTRVAHAHGVPADIFVIGADGNGLRRLTLKGLDDPRVAWSPDSQRLAYSNGLEGGIFMLEIANGQEQQIAKQGAAGGLAWARQ